MKTTNFVKKEQVIQVSAEMKGAEKEEFTIYRKGQEFGKFTFDGFQIFGDMERMERVKREYPDSEFVILPVRYKLNENITKERPTPPSGKKYIAMKTIEVDGKWIVFLEEKTEEEVKDAVKKANELFKRNFSFTFSDLF